MKLAGTIALAIIGAATLPAPVLAQEADTATELRCVLLSGRLAGAKEPQTRQAGMMMAYYFIGRLDKKFTSADLQKKLLAESQALDEEKMKAAFKVCGEQLSSRGAFLEDLGKKLSGEEAAPTGPSK
jgi:hypothetical protein